jgi:hypothetical protein
VAFIYHAFAGGLDERGHEALAQLNASYAKRVDHEKILQQNTTKMMECYPRALESAQQLGMSLHAINDLRRWRLAGNTTMEDAPYPDAAGLWLAQLERDTGLDLYRADPDTSDPMQRLMRALQAAQARFLATPERERVYSVEEAIPLLAEYVVFCIVIGARSHDATLLRSLPPLLEPFAALSPVLDAIWNNARALEANQCDGKSESARDLWLAVLAKLDTISQTELNFVKEIANAVAFAIGNMEAQLGLTSATTWADRLDRDPYQKISALQLRRIVRLEQGDWKGAERLRRQIEVLTLQSPGPQMFKSLLVVELAACARAGDLVGVQNTIERMQPIAARFPSWVPNLLYGEACFHLVRGDYEAAKLKCEECIALTQFDARGFSRNTNMWLAAQCALSEALLALDRAEAARTVAADALEVWVARANGKQPVELVRALALAEAKLGEPKAAERLEASIAEQNQLGVTGLQLGLSYEARAQIAIWQQDTAAFDRYAILTAREYRYGADSALGARYARLINEAGRLGRRTRDSLADFATSSVIDSSSFASSDLNTFVSKTMARTRRAEERAQAALQLLCASRNTRAGHLYLASPAGLVLSASQGDPAPKPALEALREFLAQTRDHADEIDEMVTGELLEEATPSAIVQADGVSYALLPLVCLVEDESTVAGVAAIALSDAPVDVLRQGQLLNALATHLLETGEYTGVTISH